VVVDEADTEVEDADEEGEEEEEEEDVVVEEFLVSDEIVVDEITVVAAAVEQFARPFTIRSFVWASTSIRINVKRPLPDLMNSNASV